MYEFTKRQREGFSVMKRFNNKWIRAAIPALLLHCSIGTVYCWSLVCEKIADEIGQSKGAVEWAFFRKRS